MHLCIGVLQIDRAVIALPCTDYTYLAMSLFTTYILGRLIIDTS